MTCPACAFENAPGAKFCSECGTALLSGPAREERKVLTVLFADLAGFTSRSERLDPEEVRALQAPYWSRLKLELERFGGTVEKFIGDAVMALFGAPVAHEDDPERAVRAALAIRDAMVALNEENPQLELHVRIGVNTGEALVSLGARPSEGEGMASGDVVNTAARLQAAAPVDGILVGETTYRATERAIDYRQEAPVEAKGKAERIPVWLALEPRWRFGVDVAQHEGTPLVGRSEELDLLLDALSRARRERSSQLVTLVGVPGIGKSRLVAELFDAVEDDPELIYWRQGRSLPYGEGVTFWALGEMVKGHAGILETDAVEEAEGKLVRAVAEVIGDPVDRDWVAGHLRPLLGLATEPDVAGDHRAEVFAAWRKFFEALAERRPLVLVFEDLQWADEGLLDFVDHLVEWASGVPLLCVCTVRPELLERRPGWGGGKRNAVAVSLSPLSDEDTARLVSALLEQSVLPADTQAALLARAGGNPLYAEEYIRMLQDRGYLRREGSTWKLESNGQVPLPESVQGIIAARLDSLPGEEKDLLQHASVIGKVVWVGALAEMVGVPRWTVEERLHALERKDFLRREQHSSVASETEYAFRHVLVRDVAYGQIPRVSRAEKHRRAAEWIESLASGRGEEHAETLAHHYLAALEYVRAAGQDTGPLAERARFALKEAGDRAMALNAFAAAKRFYAAAVELWPEDNSDRPELLARYGEAFSYEGAGDEVLSEARDGLLAAGARGRAAEMETILGGLQWTRGQRELAFEHVRRAVSLVEDEPPSRSKAFVLGNYSRYLMLAAEPAEAIRIGRQTLALLEGLEFEELRAHALNNIGVARALSGDPGGLEDLERAIEIAAEANSPEVIRAYGNMASTLAALGELKRAYELHEAGRQAAGRFGQPEWMLWLRSEYVDECYHRGRWDEALDVAEELIGHFSAFPYFMEVSCRCTRAAICIARGDSAFAEEEVRRALDFARSAKDPQIIYPALGSAARIAWETGDEERALGLADELLELVARTGFQNDSFADLAVVLEAGKRANALFEAAENLTMETRWLAAAKAYVSLEFERAAELFDEIGSLPNAAYARLRGAHKLARDSHRMQANAQLQKALGFYRSVGATALVREGESLLPASA